MAQDEALTPLRVLRTNIAAVQALVETVAGTLGPEGLDILLVDEAGRMVLTNDGIEILRQTDFQHPAARLAIEALKTLEQKVGDGTTTATVLTGALLGEALKALEQGVPVNPLLKGIQRGVDRAIAHIRTIAQPVLVGDEALYRATLVAARGDAGLAQLVWQAAQHIGSERLLHQDLNLGDWVMGQVGAESQLIAGVVVSKRPLNLPPADWQAQGAVLVLSDGLEPDGIEAQSLGTEAGFSRYLEVQAQFRQALDTLRDLGVRLVVTEKAMAPLAEAFLEEHDILALTRVLTRDRERIALLSGARSARPALLARPRTEIQSYLGTAKIHYQRATARVILQAGAGEPQATILVGALSEGVVAEQERIAVDACGALQAALRSGVVTGGGVAEFSCQAVLQPLLDETEDLSRYGIACVQSALARPLEQILRNSGWPPLEKLSLLEATRRRTGNDHLGLNCETGQVADLAQLGILDPADVKVFALSVAGEVALRVLRIQTIIRRRPDFNADL
ncbi:TCP-1/cpn60 chaperonin family protein [Anthocerotibacter panamensis]|uniref:TCP-1/cpn60 chaperonin family protein n=1 Tax=Anthocerotibacter panamensis TaxID=2857077 RepID=UPI001C40561A|nr:TCP-1/cpn60 chaperonin family protein [Anthocerotibacter panamensis]